MHDCIWENCHSPTTTTPIEIYSGLITLAEKNLIVYHMPIWTPPPPLCSKTWIGPTCTPPSPANKTEYIKYNVQYMYVSKTRTLASPLILLSMFPLLTIDKSDLQSRVDFMLIVCNCVFQEKGNLRSKSLSIPGIFLP